MADPDELRARGLYVSDLGEEWLGLSGLPMVFAVWAGRQAVHTAAAEQTFIDSYRFGMSHIDDIVRREHALRKSALNWRGSISPSTLSSNWDKPNTKGWSSSLNPRPRSAPHNTSRPLRRHRRSRTDHDDP